MRDTTCECTGFSVTIDNSKFRETVRTNFTFLHFLLFFLDLICSRAQQREDDTSLQRFQVKSWGKVDHGKIIQLWPTRKKCTILVWFHIYYNLLYSQVFGESWSWINIKLARLLQVCSRTTIVAKGEEDMNQLLSE